MSCKTAARHRTALADSPCPSPSLFFCSLRLFISSLFRVQRGVETNNKKMHHRKTLNTLCADFDSASSTAPQARMRASEGRRRALD